MRSPNFTIGIRLAGLAALMLAACSAAGAQPRAAFLTPDKAASSTAVADRISSELDERSVRVVDADLAAAAFRSEPPPEPFNMTSEEARRAGAAIGSEFLVLVRAATTQRSAFGRKAYFEAWAAVYLVSARTGRLVDWKLRSHEGATANVAGKKLDEAIPTIARELGSTMLRTYRTEITADPPPDIETAPEPGTHAAVGFRQPGPYRRLRPEYTELASLYEVAATVEILVDLDAKGEITRTEVVRWAGFGLEASVERAVRAMNWMPAARGGKTLPVRFLLRYNFRKLPKEQEAVK